MKDFLKRIFFAILLFLGTSALVLTTYDCAGGAGGGGKDSGCVDNDPNDPTNKCDNDPTEAGDPN